MQRLRIGVYSTRHSSQPAGDPCALTHAVLPNPRRCQSTKTNADALRIDHTYNHGGQCARIESEHGKREITLCILGHVHYGHLRSVAAQRNAVCDHAFGRHPTVIGGDDCHSRRGHPDNSRFGPAAAAVVVGAVAAGLPAIYISLGRHMCVCVFQVLLLSLFLLVVIVVVLLFWFDCYLLSMFAR